MRAKNANDSARRISSVSNCNNNAKKKQRAEPKSAAGNHPLPLSQRPYQLLPKVRGVAVALRPLLRRLYRLLQLLARPRVPRALRQVARRGCLVVAVRRREAGVRVSRQRALAVELLLLLRMRNSSRKSRRIRTMGSRPRRACGSRRDCGDSSRTFCVFFSFAFLC